MSCLPGHLHDQLQDPDPIGSSDPTTTIRHMRLRHFNNDGWKEAQVRKPDDVVVWPQPRIRQPPCPTPDSATPTIPTSRAHDMAAAAPESRYLTAPPPSLPATTPWRPSPACCSRCSSTCSPP